MSSDKSPERSPDERPRRTRWRRLRRLVVFVLALALVSGGVLFVYRRSLRSEIERRLQEIRDAGYPVTLEELDAWYPTPPASENAAQVYARAFAAFVPVVSREGLDEDEVLPFWEDDSLPDRGEPYPEEVKVEISLYIRRNERALALLHQAAKKKACRYLIDFTEGGPVTPHFSWLRRASHLLGLEALHHAIREDPESAGRALVSQVALAHSLRREPYIPAQAVRGRLVVRAIGSLERVLSLTALSDATLTRLSDALAAYDGSGVYDPGTVGDRCLAIWMSEAKVSVRSMEGGGPGTEELDWRVLRLLGVRDRDLIDYLDRVEELLSLAQLDDPQRLDALVELETRVAAHRAGHKLRLLSNFLAIGLQYLPRTATTTLAAVRAARMGLAVERYRIATERFPEPLTEVEPAWAPSPLADPFDGETLRYHARGDGYVVYSVGPNRADDGGENSGDELAEADDVSFSVARRRP